MTSNKKILFLTSTSLSTNPRLLKELFLARSIGMDITVIAFSLGNWSDGLDADIKKNIPGIHFVELSATRRPFFTWLVSSLLERIFRIIPYQLLSVRMLSTAISKRAYLIKKAMVDLEKKFDLIIAHNPPAFYPAFFLSKRTNAKLGIDVEDYHPGETTNSHSADRMRKYMKLILPEAQYCSYASQLIMEEVKKDMPELSKNQFVILNSFSKSEFIFPRAANSGKVKFVWYSQYIREGRGVEIFCKMMKKKPENCELHLYGSMDDAFFNKYLSSLQNIFYHGVVKQEQLHRELSSYDIGLAIEDSSENLNRQLCVTNKILSYMQAGLFVLATDTPAQKKILYNKDRSGIITTLDEKELEKTLEFIYANITEIRSWKIKLYEEGQDLAWEEESKKLESYIK